MKESARSVMEFLTENGELIYLATMIAVVLILALSVFRAYKTRQDFVYVTPDKPLSPQKYFEEAYSRGEEVSDGDYLHYREEFTAGEPEEETPSGFEYFVENYCSKLIKGCVWSLVLMSLVAAPYLVIEYLA